MRHIAVAAIVLSMLILPREADAMQASTDASFFLGQADSLLLAESLAAGRLSRYAAIAQFGDSDWEANVRINAAVVGAVDDSIQDLVSPVPVLEALQIQGATISSDLARFALGCASMVGSGQEYRAQTCSAEVAASVTDLDALRASLGTWSGGEFPMITRSSPSQVPIEAPTVTPIATALPSRGLDETTGNYTITGTLTLIDLEDGWRAGRECYGNGGYDDLRGGLDVTVGNGDGDVVGVGRLEPGEPFFLPDEVSTTGFCDFAFEVEVSEERFYVLEIGSRGDVSYSFEDLNDANWTVTFTIGSS